MSGDDDIEKQVEEQYKRDLEQIRNEIRETIDATLDGSAHENLLLASIHKWFELLSASIAFTCASLKRSII